MHMWPSDTSSNDTSSTHICMSAYPQLQTQLYARTCVRLTHNTAELPVHAQQHMTRAASAHYCPHPTPLLPWCACAGLFMLADFGVMTNVNVSREDFRKAHDLRYLPPELCVNIQGTEVPVLESFGACRNATSFANDVYQAFEAVSDVLVLRSELSRCCRWDCWDSRQRCSIACMK